MYLILDVVYTLVLGHSTPTQ